MAIIPFGEYRPDVADYNGQHSKYILNALPRGDGYGPFKDYEVYTSALPSACRGFFRALDDDGSVVTFAATSTRLYKLDNSDFTWDDVSAGGSAYTAISSSAQWQFEQFGLVIVAVQGNVAPQAFTLGSSTEFAALGGSPPNAAYVKAVGRFLVLSGLTSYPYRIQWSGLNAITTWTSGTNSSDYQDFPDGGLVRGVSGGEYGLVFQDAAIRRMTYAPGSSYIFEIDRMSDDLGLYAPYSIIRTGADVFFRATQGFYHISGTGSLTPIGKERVDRTVFLNLDSSNLQLFLGSSDPRNSRVFWAYKSISGSSGLFDKLLCYDYALQRWSLISISGEYLASAAQSGVTLDALDRISSSIDDLTFSLDDIASGKSPEIAMVNSAHKLGYFGGGNLEATLDTAEQTAEPRRMYVHGIRPITDAATVYGSVSKRERQGVDEEYSSETSVNETGISPQRVSTRYARGRIRIPAGEDWTFASGVEPIFRLEGLR